MGIDEQKVGGINKKYYVMKPRPEGMTKAEAFAYYQGRKPEELLEVKETSLCVPEKARLFDSYACECCGEVTGANWIRLADGRKLCLDCYDSYNRFVI